MIERKWKEKKNKWKISYGEESTEVSLEEKP